MRGLLSGLMLTLLAACGEGGAGVGGLLDGLAQTENTAAGPSVMLFRAGPRISGPQDYCVDDTASRPREGFAVFAGCYLMGVEGAARPGADALVTVQVGGRGSAGVQGNEEAFEALLTSPEGVTLLSASGDPATVAVDEVSHRDGLVTVHFTDFSPGAAPGLDRMEWRAFLDIQGRLATVSVRGLDRAPISREEAMSLLLATVAALGGPAQPASNVDDSETG